MPELPEVETVRRGLNEQIIGKQIAEVKIYDRTQGNISLDLESQVGTTIIGTHRQGKYLVIDFSTTFSAIVHLRMTGQLLPVARKEDAFSKHTRVAIQFTDSSWLLFNNVRRFGEMILINSDDLEEYFASKKLGPDALGIGFENFSSRLGRSRKSPIKTALLNQQILSGLGNIYAQELCYLARIDPRKPVKQLRDAERRALHKNISPLLEKAIHFNGTTFDGQYVTVKGVPGKFSEFLNVYGQDSCKSCSSGLIRISQAGRSTWFCEQCQK